MENIIFDIDKWIEERKARWAEITAMGDQSDIRDPQAILEMSDEEYAQYLAGDGGADE